MIKISREHTESCKGVRCGYDFFPFQYDFNFYLLLTPFCYSRPSNHLHFAQEVFQEVEKATYWEDEMRDENGFISYHPANHGNNLRDVIISNNTNYLLRYKFFKETLYVYGNGNSWGFCKEHNWLSILEKQERYVEQYRELEKELREMSMQGFFNYDGQRESIYSVFRDLADRNYLPVTDWHIIKMTDSLSKQINKIIQGKTDEIHNN